MQLNALLSAKLHQQLVSIAEQLRAGMDIAPAQRMRLEGYTAAAVASGADINQLAQICAQVLPSTVTIHITCAGAALQFDCWQRRAPVYPSTAE
jgi:hypothetical protein